MNDEGFQYVPLDPEQVVDVGTATDFTSIDYARERGFGLVANSFESSGTFNDSDPNQEIIDGLSPSEAEAWQIALTGAAGDSEESCQASSTEVARSELGMDSMERDFADTEERVRADPRMVAADQAWQECAAAAGHPATSRRALIDEFARRIQPLVSSRDPLAIQSLQTDEIAAAVATFDCSQQHQAIYARLHADLDAS